jgi:hypothetical protein
MKVRAALISALVFFGVQTLTSQTAEKKTSPTDQTAQRPASTGETKALSLEETLKWLSNAIETSTGARGVDPNNDQTIHTKLQVQKGCEVQLERSWRNVWKSKEDGSTQSNANSYRVLFSLADIDPESIGVHAVYPKPHQSLEVWLPARDRKKTIREIYDDSHTQMVSITGVSYFSDRNSAEHVAEALRRAALLCAKSKHL